MTNEQVENVMAIAFELARIREEHGAQSGMYLSEVRALRAEVERLAAQSAPPVHIRDRWNIERDGEDLLVCFNDHEKAEGCTYQRFTLASDVAQAAPTEPNSDLPTYTDDLELRYVEACEERDHLRAVLRAQSPAQAPVAQAVQAVELIEQEMAMLIRRLCSTTANDKTRAQAMEYLFKRGHASPLRAESAPAQAMDHPPLPEGVKARFKCEDCDGTGEVHRADGTWVGTCFCAEGKRAATTQAVRMLTDEEKVKAWNHDCNALLSYADAVIRAFCAVNANRTIPADGKIGGV